MPPTKYFYHCLVERCEDEAVVYEDTLSKIKDGCPTNAHMRLELWDTDHVDTAGTVMCDPIGDVTDVYPE